MADRPTREIETPVGKQKIVLFEWATGAIKRALGSAATADKKLEVTAKGLIVSIDGKTDDIMGALDAMHGKDFDFVASELSQTLIDSSLSEEKKS